MLIEILIWLFLIQGVQWFPAAILAGGIALAGLGTASFFLWKKYKKNNKWKPLQKSLEDFAEEVDKNNLLWAVKENGYQTHYYEWQMEIIEEKNYHLGFLRLRGEVAAHFIYYPKSNTFGEVYRNKEILSKIKTTRKDGIIHAISKILHLMQNKEWKENIFSMEKEEVLINEIEKGIKNEYPHLHNEFAEFQYHYTELFRYHLHMTEKEKEDWKRTLISFATINRQKEKDELPFKMEDVMRALNYEIKRIHHLAKSKYPKKEITLPGMDEWILMEQSMEEWALLEVKGYFDYKKMFIKIQNDLKDNKDNILLNDSWKKIYVTKDDYRNRQETFEVERKRLEHYSREKQMNQYLLEKEQ